MIHADSYISERDASQLVEVAKKRFASRNLGGACTPCAAPKSVAAKVDKGNIVVILDQYIYVKKMEELRENTGKYIRMEFNEETQN